jgi:catechol 2,3-dioxygenase-like lactoylglutathione lyase family enzyme
VSESVGAEVASPIVELAAIMLDCADPAPMVAFYAQAFAAEVSHEKDDGAWIHLDGGPLILIHRVDGHTPPTWPQPDVPKQMHFELWIDDLDEAEARLTALGATTCDHQPHRDQGNVVMLDTAGHPFCIGTRV